MLLYSMLKTLAVIAPEPAMVVNGENKNAVIFFLLTTEVFWNMFSYTFFKIMFYKFFQASTFCFHSFFLFFDA
jgi:hypothetical protein